MSTQPWCEWADDPSQYALAVRWVSLVQAFWEHLDSGASPSALKSISGEIRALEFALAMTPAARQSLRIQPTKVERRGASVVGLTARDLGVV